MEFPHHHSPLISDDPVKRKEDIGLHILPRVLVEVLDKLGARHRVVVQFDPPTCGFTLQTGPLPATGRLRTPDLLWITASRNHSDRARHPPDPFGWLRHICDIYCGRPDSRYRKAQRRYPRTRSERNTHPSTTEESPSSTLSTYIYKGTYIPRLTVLSQVILFCDVRPLHTRGCPSYSGSLLRASHRE